MFIEDILRQLSFFHRFIIISSLWECHFFFFNLPVDLFINGLTNLALEKESNIEKFTDKWMDEKNGHYQESSVEHLTCLSVSYLACYDVWDILWMDALQW